VDLRDVDAFVHAAESGTFTAAATRLFTTQPSLSRRIARLELEVGGPLFDRSNRRVPKLSPLGSAVLPHARQLLSEYGRFVELVHAQSQGRSGSITAAMADCSAPFVLPRLYQLARRQPAEARLRVVETPPGPGVRAAVLAAEADVGILGPQHLTNELDTVTFGTFTPAAFGLSDLLGTAGDPIEWAELRRLPLLLPVGAGDLTYPLGTYPLGDGTPSVVHEYGAPSTLLAMARSGLGVALLAGFAAPPGLVRRPIASSGEVRVTRLQLIWRRRSVLAPPALRLVRELRQRLSTREPFDLDEPARAAGALNGTRAT
jgi:DNA-binding transcriptional LysR family regulator